MTRCLYEGHSQKFSNTVLHIIFANICYGPMSYDITDSVLDLKNEENFPSVSLSVF